MTHLPPLPASIDNREAILTSVDRMEFISLLSRMLSLDPAQRIRPLSALQSPFITMQHLATHSNTQTVWGWIQAMAVCHQPRLSTTPLSINTHPSLQLLGHSGGGGGVLPSSCCRQSLQTGLYQTAVIPHNGAHLVSHTHFNHTLLFIP